LKILHVSYIYPQKLGVADGITDVVYNVTKELAKRGHDVSVYTSNMSDLNSNNTLKSGHLMINGVNVYYSKSIWHSKTFIATPGLISLLANNLSTYDIIHIHDCRSFQGINTYLFSRIKKIPFVYQPHGSFLSWSSQNYSKNKAYAKIVLDKLLSNRIVYHASKIIALNKTEKKQFEKFGISPDKIVIIPNGIDLSKYNAIQHSGSFRRKFGIGEEKKMLLYLGRIHKSKGIDILVKAYAYLVETLKCTNTTLVIAGPDDGYLSDAKSLVALLGISNSVLFTGHIDEADKLNALNDAELFITPSFQGFPITFLEACATATPIITTSLGEDLDWLDGNVGYVTSPSHTELSNVIYQLITNTALLRTFSENCQKIIPTFSIENTVNEIENVYKGIIKRH
jgi:glycosyltransferase involved in cell wall biosynthesis